MCKVKENRNFTQNKFITTATLSDNDSAVLMFIYEVDLVASRSVAVCMITTIQFKLETPATFYLKHIK